MTNGIITKTEEDIAIMVAGGKKLARVKAHLKKAVKEGVRASEIDKLAEKLIKNEGGEPSFKMVPNYFWTTCVNINQGVVHGIPKKEIIFKKGDVVSVDVGMFFKGFHTDTSFTVGISVDGEVQEFIETGEMALKKAIDKCKPGLAIYDISKAIEATLEKNGYSPVRALVGHGVGRDLHEDPQIPCFTKGNPDDSPEITEGATFAIEVIYAKGSPDIRVASDGWTIETTDGKIAGLFEDTVAITKRKPLVLTA